MNQAGTLDLNVETLKLQLRSQAMCSVSTADGTVNGVSSAGFEPFGEERVMVSLSMKTGGGPVYLELDRAQPTETFTGTWLGGYQVTPATELDVHLGDKGMSGSIAFHRLELVTQQEPGVAATIVPFGGPGGPHSLDGSLSWQC